VVLSLPPNFQLGGNGDRTVPNRFQRFLAIGVFREKQKANPKNELILTSIADIALAVQ